MSTEVPMPMPELPARHEGLLGIVRFRCPLRDCDWLHDDPMGREPLGPIRLPTGFTPADITAAINARASENSKAVHARIEAAITDHASQAHGGIEIFALLVFLHARLDEDEVVVRALAVPHEWHTGPGDDPDWTNEAMVLMWPPEFHTRYEEDKHWRGESFSDAEIAAHIARHDPAQVLREIEGKRALLADLLAEKHHVATDPWYTCQAATEERDGGEYGNEKYRGWPCNCGLTDRTERRLRLFAQPYSTHPDYQESWRP